MVRLTSRGMCGALTAADMCGGGTVWLCEACGAERGGGGGCVRVLDVGAGGVSEEGRVVCRFQPAAWHESWSVIGTGCASDLGCLRCLL